MRGLNSAIIDPRPGWVRGVLIPKSCDEWRHQRGEPMTAYNGAARSCGVAFCLQMRGTQARCDWRETWVTIERI